ncbi:MAG TPA: hypothetical protein VFW39_05575 [Sphingomicrobium sp.]|nr:hypothetical protein [Sphingomicrobium sp.]
MNKIAISPAASALLRLLTARARLPRDRILLTEVGSADWQSLTLAGERHQISLRVTGADSRDAVDRMCSGLEDAEFSIPGLLVADIGVLAGPRRALDGSTELTIEALTIAE